MLNLLNLDQPDLTSFFTELGEKSFRTTQVLKWIHHLGVVEFAAMTNLSKPLRQRLSEVACVSLPPIRKVQISADGSRKYLLQLDPNNAIETVFIPEDDRQTLCISTQVGCALNCSFCATAQQGFSRNLTVADLIAQLWCVEQALRAEGYATDPHGRVITHVVLMGMGEPLANFNNVVKAMRLMMDDNSYGLARRRLTLSTAGLVPAITKLKALAPVNLAVSLHAPTDELRNQLVPLNRKYPLASLLAACRDYLAGTTPHHHRITFEYVMLKDLNDSPAQARALIKLLEGCPAKVNLIPFNPFPGSSYQRSTPERIEQFRELLFKAGIVTVTRKTRGGDIAAACGQLAGQVSRSARDVVNS